MNIYCHLLYEVYNIIIYLIYCIPISLKMQYYQQYMYVIQNMLGYIIIVIRCTFLTSLQKDRN